uniref:lytic transglycosylase domain-containing protein n=1 Tax=Eubacterium cellulosolvens TaxID=29322 RepID=UPI000687FD0D|nr:lytic transglycosylase domain-containing protein [[Eubacterium] cellulosolvens]
MGRVGDVTESYLTDLRSNTGIRQTRATGNSVFDNALKVAQIENLKERRSELAARRAAEEEARVAAEEAKAREEAKTREDVTAEAMNFSSPVNALWTLAQNGGVGNLFNMIGSSLGSVNNSSSGDEYYSGNEQMEQYFRKASQTYGLSTKFLKAVAKHESNFRPDAVSYAGAVGVMQLMPGTAASLGVSDSYNAEQNIMGGAKLLKQLLEKYNGDLDLTLAAYNAGEGNVAKYGGVPSFAQVYVDGVKEKLREQGSSENDIYNTSDAYVQNINANMNPTFGMRTASGYGVYPSVDNSNYRNIVEMLRMQLLMNSTSDLGTMDFHST